MQSTSQTSTLQTEDTYNIFGGVIDILDAIRALEKGQFTFEFSSKEGAKPNAFGYMGKYVNMKVKTTTVKQIRVSYLRVYPAKYNATYKSLSVLTSMSCQSKCNQGWDWIKSGNGHVFTFMNKFYSALEESIKSAGLIPQKVVISKKQFKILMDENESESSARYCLSLATKPVHGNGGNLKTGLFEPKVSESSNGIKMMQQGAKYEISNLEDVPKVITGEGVILYAAWLSLGYISFKVGSSPTFSTSLTIENAIVGHEPAQLVKETDNYSQGLVLSDEQFTDVKNALLNMSINDSQPISSKELDQSTIE